MRGSRSGFYLHCVVGPKSGRSLELKPGLLCIGRGRDEEKRYGWLLLPDPTVSRHHANLRWDPEQSKFFYEHLSKTNPSRINGELTTQDIELGNRAQLGIGVSQFVLERQKILLGGHSTGEFTPPRKTIQPEKSRTKFTLKLLPNGYVQELLVDKSNQIGVGAYLVWVPERGKFLINTNSQARVWLTTRRDGETVRLQVQSPEEIRSGDVLSLDLCQFQFEQHEVEMPVSEQIDPEDKELIKGLKKVRKIGQGSSSEVFLMRDSAGNEVAVKFLLPHLLHDQASPVRFEREAKVAQRMQHPRLLKILHTGRTVEGIPYLVSEYLSGGTLRDLLDRQTKLDAHEASNLAAQIAEGLHHLHAHGFVHRDVKPSNIFLRKNQAVVADFGTVRGVDLNTATETGFTAGTPHYMSPEQFRGYTEARSDQYALGIVIYELVSGKRVFEADEPIALAYMHVHQPPDLSSAERHLSRDFLKVIERMLSKNPTERYPNILEATRHLQQSLA